MTIHEWLIRCIAKDATIMETLEGAIRLGFTYEQISAAIRVWMEENDL